MLPEVHTESWEVSEKENDKYKLFTELWYEIILSLQRGNSYLLMKVSRLHFCKSAVKDDKKDDMLGSCKNWDFENFENKFQEEKWGWRALDWTFLMLC